MPKSRQGRRPTRIARIAALGVAFVVVLALLAGVGAWMFLRASLPKLDGNVPGAGLASATSILRDAAGSVTVHAANRVDLAFATGYAHAQDRFFQMDLLRRAPAGELSALVGAAALATDERNRPHRFRARAQVAYRALPADQRLLIQRYADGVNAGLASLRARPFEYALLRTRPMPWQPADTLLAIDAMYLELQQGELAGVVSRDALRDSVPADMLAFLIPEASHWDAPLDGGQPVVAPANVPATRPDWLDAPAPTTVSDAFSPALSALGSNSWAVDARHGTGGRARVANDMHLGLSLPNIWYRLALVLRNEAGGTRRVSGVSLPGTPAIVAGSNGDVAWGFTNSYGHYIDLVQLELDPADPRRYRGPGGAWEEAAEHVETIGVKGGADVRLPVRDTRWGPMLAAGKHTYAVRWIAYLPGALDIAFTKMEDARDVTQALRVAQTSGIPTQNFVVADRAGHIGWTLAGPLPAQTLDPKGFSVPAAQAGAPFARLPVDAYPQLVDPPSGRLWTANGMQLSNAQEQKKIGDGGADFGARATQIRDDLLARQSFDEHDLLAIQLDDRAQWIAFWRTLALQSLDTAAIDGHPDRAAFRRIVAGWNGRADADAVGYTLVRDFHQALYDAWFGALDKRLQAIDPNASVRRASSRIEAVMETLAQGHAWLPARTANWQAFMLERVDAAIARNRRNGDSLDDARWGVRNRLADAHPFARLLPAPLRVWLSAPAQPMPGDINMPRVQGRNFGASERFVVAPGHEEDGILEMPGGASGHPLSPFFLAGHDAWVRGEPSAFLPGPDAHRLTLTPAR